MKKCKACGREFASTDPKDETCYVCSNALKRLNGYAVPVVRCKDCKKWEYDENFSGWCVEWRRRTLGNHFCSYGERREGE